MGKQQSVTKSNINPASEDVSKRDARWQQRINELAGMTKPDAFRKASEIAQAAAFTKEQELKLGRKITRRERSAMLRAMRESIQSAVHVGESIKRGDIPRADILQRAQESPDALRAEIIAASPHNPELAERVAAMAGMESTIFQAAESLHSGTSTDSAPLPVADSVESAEKGKALGRPSSYSETVADELCQWIQSGKSLQAWCKHSGIAASTVYRWMREHESFRKLYAQAHEDRADTLVEDMLEIADTVAGAVMPAEVMAAKLRIETRQWIAERMRPEKYGQKIEVQHKQPVSFSIGIAPRVKPVQTEPEALPNPHES